MRSLCVLLVTIFVLAAVAQPSFLQDNTFSGGLGQAPFQRIIQWSLKVIF